MGFFQTVPISAIKPDAANGDTMVQIMTPRDVKVIAQAFAAKREKGKVISAKCIKNSKKAYAEYEKVSECDPASDMYKKALEKFLEATLAHIDQMFFHDFPKYDPDEGTAYCSELKIWYTSFSQYMSISDRCSESYVNVYASKPTAGYPMNKWQATTSDGFRTGGCLYKVEGSDSWIIEDQSFCAKVREKIASDLAKLRLL